MWIYSLVRGGFRAKDLNGGQWPVRIIMGVLGTAEVLAEQILNPLVLSRRRALRSAHIYSALSFTLLFVPPSVFSQKSFAQSKMKACDTQAGLSPACNHSSILFHATSHNITGSKVKYTLWNYGKCTNLLFTCY